MESQCSNCDHVVSQNQLLKSKLNDIRRTVREQIREANKVKNTLTTIYEDIGKILMSTEVTASHYQNGDQDKGKLTDSTPSSSSQASQDHRIIRIIESTSSSSGSPEKKRKVSSTESNSSSNSEVTDSSITTTSQGITIRKINLRPRHSAPISHDPPPQKQEDSVFQLEPQKLPTIRINPNLQKIKLEKDYNPMVAVKEEPDIEIIGEVSHLGHHHYPDSNRMLILRAVRRKEIIKLWLNSPMNRMRPQLSVEMIVFSKPMLLYKIIDFMQVPELKLCRLINKRWKSTSTQVMLQRNCCIVKIMWDKDNKDNYFRHWTSKYTLNELIHKSMDLPCSDITILGNGNLADSTIFTFFTIHGTRIKNLDIKCYSPTLKTVDTPKRIFVDILTRQTPNLEKLSILGCNYDDWNDDDKFFLPSLRIFEWKYAEGTAYKILQAAPNLQIVIGFNLYRDLDYFIQFDKIYTIKEMFCTGKENPDSLVKFANACPKLTRLEISVTDYTTPQISKAFYRLLQVNSRTLTALSLGQLWFRDGDEIPPLNNLKVLEFGENSDKPCFPSRINLTETFPHLQAFDVTGLSGKDTSWSVYFPPPKPFIGNLKTVETLKMGDCSEFWMKQLHTLCPNFKNLAIYSDSLLQKTLPKVFRLWTHLESLDLQAKNHIICSATSLDPAITGLSEEACNRLRGSKYNLQESGFKGLKTGPSLDALKGLKSLQIIFNYTVNSVPFPLSKLSGLYGFSLLPGCHVVVHIPKHISEIKMLLVKEILGPYATVRSKVF